MIAFGLVTAVAFAVLGALSWWLLRRPRVSALTQLACTVGALWVTSVGGATWLLRAAPVSPSAATESGARLAWPVAAQSPLVSAEPQVESATGVQIAPVESLVGGLEARLKGNPDDANGWALLAQSYAYTANEEAVEHAVRRAVDLGMDETALRERVASAQRTARAGDWVDRALNTQGK